MQSTMQDFPLTTQMIFEHGRTVYADSLVQTLKPDGMRTTRYADVAERAERLANALQRLGVGQGDVVGTFCWNTQEHMEAYFAVPGMGAVLHPLNLRLFPDQLAFVINHAKDKVIIVDDSLVPLLARVKDQMSDVEHIILVGDGDASALGDVLAYEELLAAETPGFPWPELDERAPAAICYTTGTTGDPKGVAYSHRSILLHAFGSGSGATVPLTEKDRILPIVPMFHVLAWGLPYGGWSVGADFLMPERFLQAEPLSKLITEHKPTYAGAVPTIWNDVLRYAEGNPVDFSSLRLVTCGGSAVPRTLMEKFEERHGVKIIQGWGMTETSPVCALAHPPRGIAEDEQLDWRMKTGRVIFGVQLRIVDDEGDPLPWDGKAVGEIEVRGPWITGSYLGVDAPEKFHDGWLRTGDVGSVDPKGFIQITDRAKDVIKSGGEWISSVELENEIMAHPDVIEAAVIGVPDERWDERPLACVVLKEGSTATAADLNGFLASRVAKWWLPERWTIIGEIPKTSVGKFDKKVLRKSYADGGFEVSTLS